MLGTRRTDHRWSLFSALALALGAVVTALGADRGPTVGTPLARALDSALVHSERASPVPMLTVTTPANARTILDDIAVPVSGTIRTGVGLTLMTVELRGATVNTIYTNFSAPADVITTWNQILSFGLGATEITIFAEDEAGNRTVSEKRLVIIAPPYPDHSSDILVGFLTPLRMSNSTTTLADRHFPGATLYAINQVSGDLNAVTYELFHSATGTEAGVPAGTGAAVRRSDGDWQIAPMTFAQGITTIKATAHTSDGRTAEAYLEIIVPEDAAADVAVSATQTTAQAGSGNRCGNGSGLAALAAAFALLGLCRRRW